MESECTVCHKRLASTFALRGHMKSHTPSRAFVARCSDCDRKLPGINQSRVLRNPERRCQSCYQAQITGKCLRPDGYVEVIVEHRAKGKRELEHRLVMEKRLGRKLRPGETVHHINEDRADNRDENLRLYDNPGTHVIAEGHVVRGPDGKFVKSAEARKFSRRSKAGQEETEVVER